MMPPFPAPVLGVPAPIPGLADLATIIVILTIIFGASILPRMGEFIGRWKVRKLEAEPPARDDPKAGGDEDAGD